jgi:glutaredoxin
MHIAYYHIHALGDCEYCLDALKLLQDNGYQYVLTLYDKSPEALNFIKYNMDHPTVPIIYEYRKDKSIRKVGGYTELKKELDSLQEQE